MNKYFREWLKYAEENFEGGKILFNNSTENFKTLVCYNMQQAVEKYLKAYLVANGIEIDERHREHYTHNIAELIEKCKEIDPDFDKLYNIEPDRLTDYAINLKYPSNKLKTLSIEDEAQAISIAEQVKTFVVKKIMELSKVEENNQKAV